MLRKAPASSFLSPFPRFSVGCVSRPFVPRKVGRARDGRGNGRDPFSRSWKPRSRRQRRRKRRQVSCTSLAARHHRRIPTPRHEEGRIAHIHRRCLLRSPARRPSITPPPAKGWEGREEEAFSPRAASPSLRLLAPLPPSAEALVCIIGRLSPWGPRGGKENASSLSLVKREIGGVGTPGRGHKGIQEASSEMDSRRWERWASVGEEEGRRKSHSSRGDGKKR